MGWAGLGSLLVSQNKTKPSPCMVVCDHGHVWLQIAWALAGNSKHQIKLEIHKELATFLFFPVLSLFYIFIIPFSMVSHPFDRCGFKRHIDGPHGKAI